LLKMQYPPRSTLSSSSAASDVYKRQLSELTEIQRSVVLLRDYEGYTYQEIAQITELTESQVKVYIFRARQHLKNIIGKFEEII